MSTLILKVLSGPKTGLSSPITDGLSLGRKKTQIALEDPKSSNLHAIVEKQGDDFFLIDQKSRNGIKFNGKKIDQLKLVPGIEFVIGNSKICVETVEVIKKARTPQPQAQDKTHKMEGFDFQAPAEDPLDSIDIEPPHWSEVITNFITNHEDVLKNKNISVLPFQSLIELRVLRGVQANKVWTLGYGPRKVGRASLDVQLFEQEALDTCFELLPTSEGCVFKTDYPNKVLLDGKNTNSKVLIGGEIITIGVTQIQVGFIYE